MVHSIDVLPENSAPLFVKRLAIFFIFFRVALVEQLGNDGWQVVCAGCCHMTLVLCIMQLYKDFFIIFYFLSFP